MQWIDMKDKTTVKCCACGEDVVLTTDTTPTWLGVYEGCKMKKAIHVECRRKPENKEWWKD